jgi:hypothetical protein
MVAHLDHLPCRADHSCDSAGHVFDRQVGWRGMAWRHLSRLPVFGALVALECHPPRAAHPLQVANAGATFEVELNGCFTTGPTGRRFGPDVRAALVWSSERVHTAGYLPCTATIRAVRAGQRTAVYRVSRTRDGAYTEEMLHPQP